MPDIISIICKLLLFQVRCTILKKIVLTSNFAVLQNKCSGNIFPVCRNLDFILCLGNYYFFLNCVILTLTSC